MSETSVKRMTRPTKSVGSHQFDCRERATYQPGTYCSGGTQSGATRTRWGGATGPGATFQSNDGGQLAVQPELVVTVPLAVPKMFNAKSTNINVAPSPFPLSILCIPEFLRFMASNRLVEGWLEGLSHFRYYSSPIFLPSVRQPRIIDNEPGVSGCAPNAVHPLIV